MHSWNTFGARTNYEQTWTHKTHHGPNLREATTFPLIVFFVSNHGASTQMSFRPKTLNLGVPIFPKLGLLQLWRPIIFCANPQLKWCPKKSCNLHQELFNSMLHATYKKLNQGNFRLLMVGSQIGNLTLSPSFGHNLCFKYPNGSCEHILVARVFH
jgi:hypothetical protein